MVVLYAQEVLLILATLNASFYILGVGFSDKLLDEPEVFDIFFLQK